MNKHFSQEISVFHNRQVPEIGYLVGYGAIIDKFKLALPMPRTLSLISKKHKKYTTGHWQVFTPRHEPEDTLLGHLVFALKYEGISLLFFKKLFGQLQEEHIAEWVNKEPQSQYTRRIWFLYEWLMQKQLHLTDLKRGNYVDLVDTRLQFGIAKGSKSPRHRLINNLPGTVQFCPMVNKEPRINQYIEAGLATIQDDYVQRIRKDIWQRASAFLLLKDSKASFTIEGESPGSKKTAGWGLAIGQAGQMELTKESILRLQHQVIENPRFLEMGYRQKGGFIGVHDRSTGEPIPDHISARWQDIEMLMEGLQETAQLLIKNDIDAVISAAVIAFGFVFIHPFEDGNGRVHRYLIHHVLAKKNFSRQGITFPVSAAILDDINGYRDILESYSRPLLEHIDWKETKDHNVEVLNETMDYYRYFDATEQAAFLYDCVNETIQRIIPEEVEYLSLYDAFKIKMVHEYNMPDKLISLLVRFLEQHNGIISKRAREKELESLTDTEVQAIENTYNEIFTSD